MSLAKALPFLTQLLQATPGPQAPLEGGGMQPQPTNPAPAPDTSQVSSTRQGPGQMAEGLAPAPVAPQQTKAHKLLQILQGGLVGGLSGLAANAQTYAATGRNAGFGGGVGAGFTQALPFAAQEQQARLQQQQAQTELTKQQASMVQTPYGPLPMTLAKVIFGPSIAAGAKIGSAQIGAGAREQAAETGKEGRLGAAQIMAGKPIVVSGKGAFQKDENGQYQPIAGAQMPQVLMTPEEAQQIGHPELANQELPMTAYSALLRGTASQTSTVQGAAGPATVNKITGKTKSLGLGSPGVAVANARPVQVADDANPGNTKFTTAGQAIQSGAAGPQSASVQVPRAAAKAEVPTKIGDQKVAFTTAMQHADLLTAAVNALNNGDQQTLNSLKNRFAAEFGASGPVTAQVIAGAYTRETNKMLSAGHMTDSDLREIGSTLNVNRQSPGQSLGVLAAYKKLAQSKMNMLNQQKQNAINQSQKGGGSQAQEIHYKIVNGQLVKQ